jgi:hypothetical protein
MSLTNIQHPDSATGRPYEFVQDGHAVGLDMFNVPEGLIAAKDETSGNVVVFNPRTDVRRIDDRLHGVTLWLHTQTTPVNIYGPTAALVRSWIGMAPVSEITGERVVFIDKGKAALSDGQPQDPSTEPHR